MFFYNMKLHLHASRRRCLLCNMWEREREVRPASSAVSVQHVIAMKLNEYITPWLRGAPTWQLVSIMLQETKLLILVSWRRIICTKRGVKRDRELSSFASSTDGRLLGAARGLESLNEQKHRYPHLTHEIIIIGINSTSRGAFILWSI